MKAPEHDIGSAPPVPQVGTRTHEGLTEDRLRLRTDGFVSVRALYEGVSLLTRPLRFQGRELSINYSTSAAGSVQVEIQDASGKAISGYGVEDCPEIVGDEIERVISWKGGSDVSQLADRAIRLPIRPEGWRSIPYGFNEDRSRGRVKGANLAAGNRAGE